MKKILLFKKGLFEKILNNNYQELSSQDLKKLLEDILGFKLKHYSFKNLLEQGLDNKNALMVSCAYELGRRCNKLGKTQEIELC